MKRPGPIVITGFMGCGKSKVARELALRRDVVMVDLDEWITARVGRSPAQLINEDGCTTVWLDTPFAICWERIAASEEDRPLGRTREEARARYDLRKPIY